MPIIDPAVTAPDWILSPEGRLKSVKLATALEPYGPDAIVSSTEPKAIETGQIVADHFGLQLDTVPDLHEHDRRGGPFLSQQEFRNRVAELFARPSAIVFGNETAEDAYKRFDAAVTAVATTSTAKTLVIVTHGTVISLFVAAKTGVDPYPLWERLGLPSFVTVSWPDVRLIEVVEELNGS